LERAILRRFSRQSSANRLCEETYRCAKAGKLAAVRSVEDIRSLPVAVGYNPKPALGSHETTSVKERTGGVAPLPY
jgi:hypothetical protein